MTRLRTLVAGTIAPTSVTCGQQSSSGDHFALHNRCSPIHSDASDPFPGSQLDGGPTDDALRGLVEHQFTDAGIELDHG